MPCNGVTHTDGTAPFPSFSVTCTLVMFSEYFPWASSPIVSQIHPSAWLFQFLCTPRWVFLHGLHLMDICEIFLRIIITKKLLFKTKHTAQNLLQFSVNAFPHHPQLSLSCEQEYWVARTERCLKCSILHPPESPLAIGFFFEHLFSLLYFQIKYGLTLCSY